MCTKNAKVDATIILNTPAPHFTFKDSSSVFWLSSALIAPKAQIDCHIGKFAGNIRRAFWAIRCHIKSEKLVACVRVCVYVCAR